jgi:hypothetical protein
VNAPAAAIHVSPPERSPHRRNLSVYGVPDIEQWIKDQRKSKYCTAPGGGGLAQVATQEIQQASAHFSRGDELTGNQHLNRAKRVMREIGSDNEAQDRSLVRAVGVARVLARIAGEPDAALRNELIDGTLIRLAPELARFPEAVEIDRVAMDLMTRAKG